MVGLKLRMSVLHSVHSNHLSHSSFKGPFTPSLSINADMTLAMLLSLKPMELLQNGLLPYSGAAPLFLMEHHGWYHQRVVTALVQMLGVN